MTDTHKEHVSADAVYAAVAARRSQWDALLWQVPALSMTAQAFLLTVSLSATQRIARTLACGLSVLTTFLSIHLMTRHRQAETADSEALAEMERASGRQTIHHGVDWRRRRETTNANAGLFESLTKLPGYMTWSIGLSIFGLVAVTILILTWAVPGALQGTNI